MTTEDYKSVIHRSGTLGHYTLGKVLTNDVINDTLYGADRAARLRMALILLSNDADAVQTHLDKIKLAGGCHVTEWAALTKATSYACGVVDALQAATGISRDAFVKRGVNMQAIEDACAYLVKTFN